MKTIFISACLLLSFTSFAQLNVFPKKPKPAGDLFNKYLSVQKADPGLFPKATLTGRSSIGKIYALPLDNMPCYVPDISFIRPIPNARIAVSPNSLMMPNPFKKEDIIPAH